MIENNRLIAEFLGWEQFGSIGLYDTTFHNNKGSLHWLTKDMRFHNDWNWLMLVVNKIESSPQCEVVIDKDLVEIYYKTYRKSFKEVSTSKIEATYEACVEFIKWYNEYI